MKNASIWNRILFTKYKIAVFLGDGSQACGIQITSKTYKLPLNLMEVYIDKGRHIFIVKIV